MKKKEKLLVIDYLQKILNKSNVIYLADTQGLNGNTTSQFRRSCFKENIEIKVVKNTLLKRAMKQTQNKDYSKILASIKGNVTILLSNNNSAPAKLIQSFRKISNTPILKAAWIDQSVYIGDHNLETLSRLKSRYELIGEIIYSLQSPIKIILSLVKSGSFSIAGIIEKLSKK